MYDRLNLLLGTDSLEKIHKANILLLGVGGVGSFCFEVLIRSGIKNITIIDFDIYEESNLNRQLHSNKENIGRKKVEVLKEYAYKINSSIKVNAIDAFLDENYDIDITKYDYIIDAVDSIKAKKYFIKLADSKNIPLISSMGIAGKMDSTKLLVTTLDKTYNDPLAKNLRSMLNKEHLNHPVKVVFSSEIPTKSKENLPSYIVVTAYAGILLADTVIKDLIK